MNDPRRRAGAILRKLRVWVARRRTTVATGIETPEPAVDVIGTCGRCVPQVDVESADGRQRPPARPYRWPPGPSLDNFS
jgi:hypothetical protein